VHPAGAADRARRRDAGASPGRVARAAAEVRFLAARKGGNPACAARIRSIDADRDRWGQGALARDRAIPRRSTLVLMRGATEPGRLVAETGRAAIEAPLDRGLTEA
jgi:hypothetical protein